MLFRSTGKFQHFSNAFPMLFQHFPNTSNAPTNAFFNTIQRRHKIHNRLSIFPTHNNVLEKVQRLFCAFYAEIQDFSNIKQRTSSHCDLDNVIKYQGLNRRSLYFFIVIVSWKIGFLSLSRQLKINVCVNIRMFNITTPS